MAAILFADRVKDTTTTTGTGNVTLSGSPPSGYQSFNSAFGTSTQFYYCIEGGGEWEVGEGHLSASTTLVRDFVRASSNAGATVNFSAGTKNVFSTLPGTHVDNHAWKTVVKPSDTNRTSTTTVADDPSLLFAMEANTSYYIELLVTLFVRVTPGFKYSLSVPSGGFFRAMDRITSVNTTRTGEIITTIPTNTAITTGTQNYGYLHLRGPYANGANAGNFAFQWAQNVSDGSNAATVVGGSILRYLKITA